MEICWSFSKEWSPNVLLDLNNKRRDRKVRKQWKDMKKIRVSTLQSRNCWHGRILCWHVWTVPKQHKCHSTTWRIFECYGGQKKETLNVIGRNECTFRQYAQQEQKFITPKNSVQGIMISALQPRGMDLSQQKFEEIKFFHEGKKYADIRHMNTKLFS